jgi:superfamily II DNA helicase RecQ
MTLNVSLAQVPLTVLVPESLSSSAPLEIFDRSSGIHAAFVDRDTIDSLPVHWRTSCGFYILFSGIDDQGKFDAYVSKASSGFHRRLASHHETKDFWKRALLITKEGEPDFTPNQSEWLEERISSIFESAKQINMRNIASANSSYLPREEHREMENVILSTLRIMALRDYKDKSFTTVYNPPAQEFTFTPTPPVLGTMDSTNQGIVSPENQRFEALKEWRKEESQRASISPFIIFHDKTLREISRANPDSLDSLRAIPGVGPYKTSLYGERIMATFAAVNT